MNQKPQEPHKVIARSDEFDQRVDARLKEMAAEDVGLDWLVTTGRRNRRGIKRLALILVPDLLFTMLFAVSYFSVNNACNSANRVRTADRQLWLYVLDHSTADPRNNTPQGKKQIQEFRVYVDGVFKNRDCGFFATIKST